ATPTRFACDRCHPITTFSPAYKGAWGEVIAYLTAGLLYGHEVERPPGIADPAERKTAYVSRHYKPKEKYVRLRAAVLERLMKGWSQQHIARDLGVPYTSVVAQRRALYKQHV